MKWESTKFSGVRCRQHPTRKHGVARNDRYFAIRYQHQGKRVEEGLGWASEGWTGEKAALKLAELKKAARIGEGPQHLKEKREIETHRRVSIARDALTFGDFFEKTYYPIAKQSKKPESYKHELSHFLKWISSAIGAIPLKDLRPIHLERLKKTLLDAGKSPRTIQYIFSTVRVVWNHAKKNRMIEGDSPTKAVQKPKVENRRIRYLTAEEAQALLADLKRRDLATYRMAAIALFMGLRAGEIFNLKWKSLHQENGLLWVMDGKSGKSRAVYMPDQVKDLFREMIPGNPEALVFPGPAGKLREIPSFFRTAVKKLELNEGITDRRERFSFHSLRHSCASFLIQNGVDLYTIKEILGHGSIALTERYSHLASKTLKEAAQKIPDLTGNQAAQGKVIELKK